MGSFPKGMRRGGERAVTDMQGVPVQVVYDPDNDEVLMVATSDSGGAPKVYNFVYNPSTLSWERMKQPVVELSGDLTVTMGDVEAATNNTYWRKTLYDYDVNDNVIYKGFHITYNAADSDTSHYIIKYTYTGDNVTKKQLAVGAWTNRTGLSW